MLAGLSEDYDPLVTSITTRVEPISLTDLYAHMLSFGMHKEHHNSVFQITANSVVRSGRGGRDGSRGRGRNNSNGGSGCGKPNFNSSNNSSPVGNFNNSSPVRNGNRLQCQVCGKMGHVALKCCHCFDHSYQAEENHVAAMATTPSYGVDAN